jgi:ornithine cyclodeaminase/alanine dehydrogenase-like protein (mu-crystallin family)
MPKLERIDVVARSMDRAQAFCDRMRARIGVELRAAGDAEKAVAGSDIVTTATGARKPVFNGRWLKPGTHVNAVGSNFANKQEIDANAVSRSTRIVVDDWDVARIESGDLLIADQEIGLDWASVEPLANVVAGKTPGRRNESEITLFESQGIGLEDLAAAYRVLELASSSSVGEEIALR